MSTEIQLADDYYLTNFHTLLHHATSLYDDLLDPTETQWIDDFQALSPNAQCLLVRLYSRKGPWYRSDKLQYAEISSIDSALAELATHSFIKLSPSLTEQELVLHLLTKPETLALFPSLPRNAKKSELVALCHTSEFSHWDALSFQVIELLSPEMAQRLLILFFGNTRQDLTEFVLSDLGMRQYEAYPLSRDRRYFSSRSEINQHISLAKISNTYWAGNRKSVDFLSELFSSIPNSIGHHQIDRRREHLINDIARDFERLSEFDLALAAFETTNVIPSRERRCRIYDKLDMMDAYSTTVTSMMNAPIDVSEYEVALKLSDRLKRKQGIKIPRVKKPTLNEIHLDLDLSEHRVELAVLSHLTQEGWHVFYSENSLLTGLFGLAFWQVIFSPVENAFINAYQYKPLDLYHPDFTERRARAIEEVLAKIAIGNYQRLWDNFHQKQGIANAFVHWTLINEDLIRLALKTIPPQTLHALFEVLLSDLKLYRNGMPDLIAFKDDEFIWIEVKGPGDKLQDNQWRWIHQFQRLNVPFKLCLVNQ